MSPDFSRAKWRKSSHSDSGGCVEVACAGGVIGVRDTKQAGAGPMLAFAKPGWAAFVASAAAGHFGSDDSPAVR
ncbi:DUF397 domain-containing protein [Micromonospora sp. NBRC 110037]|uniref:DUF397 domain-containing protein n=1 Tax=Micromonospora TaxID=1873 RepID=UPI0035A3A212